MPIAIIITVCSLLLLAYIFDISSALTKIPSVILLLLTGWLVRQLTFLVAIEVPDLNPLLPIFGTIGLILIVLEGSLELQLNKSKVSVINKSFLIALLSMVVLAFILAATFQYYEYISFKDALLNAIPFCVISSAIAIPSVRNLTRSNKEFVIYESSLSDILGVLFFNFIAVNTIINLESFLHFGLSIFIVVLGSFVSVIGLSFLLSRIKHHVTFSPIILLVILIYGIAKHFHLPALIFIFVFGLFLGNLDELKRFKWIERLRPVKLDKEVAKFKEITIEATFLIRALFFLLFGFLMSAHEILNTVTLPWAVGTVIAIITIRWIALKVAGFPALPLLFIAPRGLITILLFIAIIPEQASTLVNPSYIIQTIILSVFVMMIGIMMGKKDRSERVEESIVEVDVQKP
ncbi:MAG TPA: sodium:proton antiporter [Bacteroidia bacterium]|nr:sodium:proton antiporter [Bacteroidia bacterium]